MSEADWGPSADKFKYAEPRSDDALVADLRGHAVRVVQFDARGRPMLVQCVCGEIGGLPEGFTAQDRGDGTATVNPSIDYKGHFHTDGSVRVAVGDVDLSLRKSR